MGGAKTVDPSKYISKRDPSRDVAIAMLMQQAQAQQMANQAQMLQQYAGITPDQQTYDAIAQSRRAAELGLQNVLRQREMERITNPQAEALRLAQSKQLEDLTAKENADRYMGREYMLSEGLPTQYETGLGDSTIGRAAMYDRALQAKKAYEESLALQRQAYLAKTAQPSGGISPETSIAAQQAAEAQNIAAQEAYKQGMFGSIGGFGQSSADAANQLFSNLARMKQAQQQSELARNQMMLTGQQQAAESRNAMTGAYIDAAGKAVSSLTGLAGMAGGGGGGGGLLSTGGYGSLAGMQKATIPGTTGSYVGGVGYVPRATLAK